MRRLIELGFVEADGESLDPLAPMTLQDRGEDRGVDATGKENADGYVRDHAVAEGVDHERLQLIGQLVFTPRPLIPGRIEHAPVSSDFRFTFRAQFQPVPGGKFEDVLINAVRLDDVTVTEVIDYRRTVKLGGPVPEGPQRLQFGPEPERVSVPAVIQRLDPQAVAQQIKPAVGFRPERDGEHADEAAYRPRTPLGERLENHLGIAGSEKSVAQHFQVFANLAKVIDLSVKYHHPAAVAGRHGLMSEGREVQDRQPGVAQSDAAVEP